MKSKQPERWKKESKAVKATQIAFDISTEVQKRLKLTAIQNDVSPSDQMLKILGARLSRSSHHPQLCAEAKAQVT